MEQTYTLTRAFDAEGTRPHTFTVTDTDAINCAHMLAAGFNTISRNFMHTYVLAVVDTEDGRVFYDGKIEQIKRAEPSITMPASETSFKFEASTAADAETILTLFDDENGKLIFPGKFKIKQPSKYEFISRPVLEAAYAELEAVKEVLFDAGVETIPADRGVKDLQHVLRARDDEIAELAQERANREQSNAAARAELIRLVSGAYTKLQRIDKDGNRADLQARFRGMLDVLAGFLVATDEADYDERHAVARRLAGVDDVEA